MGQRALMLLPLSTFAIVVFLMGVGEPLFISFLLHGGVWLFKLILGLIVALFALGMRWTYNRVGARLLDLLVQRRLTDMAYGNDTRDFRVTRVSSCPPISGRIGACPNLPSTIDDELICRANKEAERLVPSVRKLLYPASTHTPTLADYQNLPGFSGRELVHTSYFDNEDVLRIIHAHIVMQSRAPGLSLKGLDPLHRGMDSQIQDCGGASLCSARVKNAYCPFVR